MGHKNHEGMNHGPAMHKGHGPSAVYNFNLQTDPAAPKASTPVAITMSVTEQKIGDPIAEFEYAHDKLMHLIIVRDDLSHFAHLHPNLREGIFSVRHTFPESGEYKLWADAKPKGGTQTLVAFRVTVGGKPYRKIELVPDTSFSKRSSDGIYEVSLKLPEKIVAGNPISISFEITDAGGKPITDLEPLMGAGGHCVVISGDAREFLHVHPLQEVDHDWRGGPEVAFQAIFPRAGLYKIWGQFQHKGKVLTESFTVSVSESG
jgi:hypothetical protein